jgi:hypothetical protein
VRALIEPFSGVAGDMLLGALIDLGLHEDFLRGLPHALGIAGVDVRIARVSRASLQAVKVDFGIPPQPHGRHLKHLLEIVDRAPAPGRVKARAAEAFHAIATIEAEVHGTTIERVHLHEVGAVDAILDIVGVLWGFDELGVTDVRCGPVALGDGSVDTAHGRLPVPAPATLRLLEGLPVASGPPDSGELATPTGAALVRVLSSGPLPMSWVPRRIGYGAGTKEFSDRPNVVRVVLTDMIQGTSRETLVLLTADIDDATPEALAEGADAIRESGLALDVTLAPVLMKKGRLGTRIEVLATTASADEAEAALFRNTTTIGVRRAEVLRAALPRESLTVGVLGQTIRLKRVTLPGGEMRVKPEFEDLRAAALATGRTIYEIAALAEAAAPPGTAGVPFPDS